MSAMRNLEASGEIPRTCVSWEKLMKIVNADDQGSPNSTLSGPERPTAETASDASGMQAVIDLLVTQIKTQDPTKPIDSSEFLSQFSALSQAKSMEHTQSRQVLMDNLQKTTGPGLVGQEAKISVEPVWTEQC